MRSGPHLEIELDRPELLVRGTFDEATPALLSGRLVVHSSETIRVRSLRLVFTGRVDTFVSQAVCTVRTDQDEHREILTHTWNFLTSHKHSTEQLSGRSEYPFELLVSGDNPETIHTALGKVRYELRATLERPGLHTNTSVSREVAVKRGPVAGAPWALALMESIEAVGTWDQQLEYRVTVPTRSVTDNELFHTRFELQPRCKGLTLVAVGVLIKEYTRYYNSRMQPVHRFSRVVARNENYVTQSGSCSVDPLKPSECMSLVDATSIHVPLVVPAAYTHIQYDVTTELVEVRHRIKFLIKVRDSRMLIHSVFVAVPVCVQPVSARDEASILPRYEGMGQNGTLIMRSETLPPAYGDVDVGEDVDGFPGALRHSRSQFYLASPDHSPRIGATQGSVALADGSETLQSSETLQGASEILPLSALPNPSPCNRTSATRNASSVSTLTHPSNSHCDPSTKHCPQERRTSNRVADKVRSIFQHTRHGRTNSCEELPGRSMTPDHVQSVVRVPRRNSVTPAGLRSESLVHSPVADVQTPNDQLPKPPAAQPPSPRRLLI
ncbi:hypothetical protein GGH12_004577 [Coemansia sp. RSA 1822]|nr:hypothetical protein GGF49_001354 [Coemansia sp. RSA 1853]KAJ2560709.1 hypothetical protein GGH12_004577 [Coemansia sp. RSA 1822]